MKKLLEESFYCKFKDIRNSDYINKLEKNTEKNKKRLKGRISKKEKKLLLRITDEKDLKAEEMSFDSYIHGFKLGLKIGYESNKD